jgi:hypothetical protein
MFFPLFFHQPFRPFARKSPISLLIIAGFCALTYTVSVSIADPELGNRVLHTFGGGVAGMLACFLAARDSGIKITRFQFFVLSALIVLALGIGNEMIEFMLQSSGIRVFARTADDTWLDLASNGVGILFAVICLLPLHRSKEFEE